MLLTSDWGCRSARGRSWARTSTLVISAWPRPLQLCFAHANMNSTAKKAYWPMCLPNRRHIGPIRLSMPGENTAKVKEKDARIVPCMCTVFLYSLSKKLVFLPLASAMTALHTCLSHRKCTPSDPLPTVMGPDRHPTKND